MPAFTYKWKRKAVKKCIWSVYRKSIPPFSNAGKRNYGTRQYQFEYQTFHFYILFVVPPNPSSAGLKPAAELGFGGTSASSL
jgi:hypothetical protein